MSLWIAGTDTGVGKTVASAAALARYASPRSPIAYWKPVATGAAADRDPAAIAAWLGRAAAVLPECYRFDPPLSPHLAARLAGVEIDPDRILSDLVRHASAAPDRNLIIEGIGGLLVPLTGRGYLLINLIAESALPVVLVARSTLGTINHTLLSLAALRERRIEIAGVVMNGPPDRHNREAIESFGRVEVIAEIPPLVGGWDGRGEAKLTGTAIRTAARRFDASRVLSRYLGTDLEAAAESRGAPGRTQRRGKKDGV